MTTTLTVLIPAFNEESALPFVLPDVISCCRTNHYELIVINDGSLDDTAGMLCRFQHDWPRMQIITHKLNRGYGGAIKSGIRACRTRYVITFDGDGQHDPGDIEKLYETLLRADADMVVGNRGASSSGYYRTAGKWLIRTIARILLPVPIRDLNSGIKIYDADLAKRYIRLCPDSMAFSDVIALFFISQRHLVTEAPVHIKPRKSGQSSITTRTAIGTVKEILNIVVLFNPMRLFFPLAVLFFLAGLAWGVPILLMGRGLSVGALLGITTGIIFFTLGLIAEQLSHILKSQAEE